MSAHVVEVDDNIHLDSYSQSKATDRRAGNVNEKQLHADTLAEAIGEEYRLPGMTKENTTWDVYNNEARKVDNELVKDWTASLHFLLLFAAIFAAVLTAFIIESKKMLEEDPTDVLVDIMILVTTNLANGTHTPYSRNTFEPTSMAISVNCLLFASLGVSLVAALASVIALQWVADYDAAITRGGSSPEDRAKRRQFRFAGVTKWKMGEIIAALPLLLYSSVALFWAGAIQWMWSIHHTVGYVVAGATAIAALFYFSTTLLGAIYVSTPFHSPLSRGIYWLFVPITSWIYRSSEQWLGHRLLWKWLIQHKVRIWHVGMISSSVLGVALFTAGLLLRNVSLLLVNDFILPVAIVLIIAWILSKARQPSILWKRFILWKKSHVAPWIAENLLPHATLRQLEDRVAKADSSLTKEALNWIAQQLIVSEDSHHRLLLILQEVSNYTSIESLSSDFFEGPWWAIFHYLGWQYMQKVVNGTLSTDDGEVVRILLSCASVPAIKQMITPGQNYETDSKNATYWNQFYFEQPNPRVYPEMSSVNMVFLLARDVPVPSMYSKQEIDTTIELIKWRNTEGLKDIAIWNKIIVQPNLYTPEYYKSCLQHFAKITPIFRQKKETTLSFTSLWINGHDEGEVCDQIVETLLTLDEYMDIAEDPTSHNLFTRLICGELERIGYEWPSSSAWPESLAQRIAGIRDPCLAVIGEYVQGVSESVAITTTNEYRIKYELSIKAVRDFLYKNMSPTDQSALWQLRAVIWTEDDWAVQMYRSAFFDPKQLSCLQLIFQHPMPCHALSDSFHLLYHLSTYRYKEEGPSPWLGLSPIVVTLLSPFDIPTRHPQELPESFDVDCVKRIQEICMVVDNHPACFFALLTQIINGAYPRYRTQTNLTVSLLEAAMPRFHDRSLVHLLRPMAMATEAFRIRIEEYQIEEYQTFPPFWEWSSPHLKFLRHAIRKRLPRKYVPPIGSFASSIARAKKVSALLYNKSAMEIITSPSHLRVLSCTRACTSTQPATGWLPECVGL